MLVSTTSERQGRMIDRDQSGSMELKKRQRVFLRSRRMNNAIAQQIADQGGVESYLRTAAQEPAALSDLRQRR